MSYVSQNLTNFTHLAGPIGSIKLWRSFVGGVLEKRAGFPEDLRFARFPDRSQICKICVKNSLRMSNLSHFHEFGKNAFERKSPAKSDGRAGGGEEFQMFLKGFPTDLKFLHFAKF